MDSEAVTAFREQYRREQIPGWYSGYLHLALTSLGSLATIAAAVLALDDVGPLEWLTIPLMFVLANLVEYFGHRGPMHRRVRGLGLIHKRHALQHHRFFCTGSMEFDSSRDFHAVLFPLVILAFYLGLIAVPVSALLAWLVSLNVGLLALAVSVAYFLNYEWMHFAYHAPPGSRLARLPMMSRLRGLHHLHHRPELMTRYNFNITYPIGDWLFGTLYRSRS